MNKRREGFDSMSVRAFVSVVLALIVMIASATEALAAVKLPITGLEVSDSYASGKYYTKLLAEMSASAGKTPAERFVMIANSQSGYSGSSTSGNYAGNGNAGKYNEYSRHMGVNGQPWCASFVSWCAKAAGLSTSVMPRGTGCGTFRNAKVGTVTWLWSSDFTEYNSSAEIAPGDIVLFMPQDYTTDKSMTFTAYNGGTSKSYTIAGGDHCGGHYMSRGSTAHVAIVKTAVRNDKNDPSKGYTITTIERKGNVVGHRTINTASRSGYTACSHVYGKSQKIPMLQAVYRPNWSAASMWSASMFDSQAPVVSSVTTKNLSSSGFDVVVKATDNVAVSKIRIDVWSGGVRRYDVTTDVSNTTSYAGTFRLNWSDLGGASNTSYRVNVYAIDEYGNGSGRKYLDVFADTSAPDNISLDVTNLTNTGYDLTVSAEDENGIANVKITIWSMAQERYNQTHTVSGGTEFSKTFHFDFTDLGGVANTTYRNNINVTDGMGNTSSRIYTDVYADMTAPEITFAQIEGEGDEGFDVRIQATDKIEIESVIAEIFHDGTMVSQLTREVGGLTEYEGVLHYSYPDETEETETYTVYVLAVDTAGNVREQKLSPVVRNAPNTLPDEYFEGEDVWAFEIVNDRAYIVGLADPSVMVEELSASQWPKTVTKDGRVYAVAGTKQAEDSSVSFSALPNLKRINGFPAEYVNISGFVGCENLTSVTMDVRSVLVDAFADCPALEFVELGPKLSEIRTGAFANCGSLTQLRYAGSRENWEKYVYSLWDGDIAFKYDVIGTVSAEPTDTGCPVRAAFKSSGYADGNALIWSECRVNVNEVLSDGTRNHYLGLIELSSIGSGCSVFFDVSEIMRKALEHETDYNVEVIVSCDGIEMWENCDFRTKASSYDDVYVTDMLLNHSGASLTVGDTLQMYRTAIPGNATNKNITWTSSNPSVATVSGSGLVTAVSSGTATITCTAKGSDPSGSVTKTCSIRVMTSGSCSGCSTSYANWYRVKNTGGSLAISSIHGASTSSGATKLGSVPEGAVVYVTKATGYSGLGSSSGQYGHVSYNGVSGFCSMNYLEAAPGMTVNLDMNGGYAPSDFGTTYLYMRAGTPINYVANRTPARTGYTFEGWAADAAGNHMVFDASGISIVDGTYWVNDSAYGRVWSGANLSKLYAVWSPAEYTITFNPCGGSMNKRTATVVYGTAAGNAQTTLPTKAGYIFLGWYTAAEGGTQVYNEIGQCANNENYFNNTVWNHPGDVTVYAHWSPSDFTPPVISDVKVSGIDAEGFTVSCSVRDKIDTVTVKAWTGTFTEETEEFVEENVVETEAIVVGGYAEARIDVPAGAASYNLTIVARDTAGNETEYQSDEEDAVYIDGAAPQITDVKVQNLSGDGFTISCAAMDDSRVGRVQVLVWTGSEPEGDDWMTDEQCSAQLSGGRWIYHADAAALGGQAGEYHVIICALDVVGKASELSSLTVNVPAKNPSALAYAVYENHVYVLYSAAGSSDWTGAVQLCEAMGGHLVTIGSEEENAAISAMLGENGAAWIGMSCAEEGEWTWVDGSVVGYTNWADGQPDEACAVMNADGTWSGAEPGYARAFIFEFEGAVLELPPVKCVGEEAFVGTDVQIAVIPESCEQISSRAFAECADLRYVLLPAGAQIEIAADAFDGSGAVLIER